MTFHNGTWHVCSDCGHRRWIEPGCAIVCDQVHRSATLGDALDRALGGAEHFVSDYCSKPLPGYRRPTRHHLCAGFYGGRSCECRCHAPAVHYADDSLEYQERVKQDAYERGFDRETD